MYLWKYIYENIAMRIYLWEYIYENIPQPLSTSILCDVVEVLWWGLRLTWCNHRDAPHKEREEAQNKDLRKCLVLMKLQRVLFIFLNQKIKDINFPEMHLSCLSIKLWSSNIKELSTQRMIYTVLCWVGLSNVVQISLYVRISSVRLPKFSVNVKCDSVFSDSPSAYQISQS